MGRIAPLFSLALAGCVTLPSLCPPRTSMKLHFENEAMRAEILKYLSVGMPIENAKRIMEDSGFKCQEGWFSGPAYLHCSAVYGTHHLLIADEIRVRLYHEAGKLSGIRVDCHSVGP